jgi:putative Holliday junction resolvase
MVLQLAGKVVSLWSLVVGHPGGSGKHQQLGVGANAALWFFANDQRPTANDQYNFPVPDSPALPRRILGLDVGSKTIGMAVSDPLGITAQGMPTLRRKNKRIDLQALENVIRKYEVAEIVVGYPLRMSGAEGTQSEKMARFAEDLRQYFNLPVHLWDERLTSAEANRVLRESEMSIKRRGEVVDQLAAVLILQSWMEAKNSR